MILIVILALLFALLTVVIVVVIKANKNAPKSVGVVIDDDCCGAHAVCERDTLLSSTDDVMYFDDEELDTLSGKGDRYSDSEIEMIEEVFYSLREQDVSGWVRSLQLRNIELPNHLREQALMLISERRDNTLETWKAKH